MKTLTEITVRVSMDTHAEADRLAYIIEKVVAEQHIGSFMVFIRREKNNDQQKD